MLSLYWIKIKNFLVFSSNLLIDFLIKRKKILPQQKTLLLVKLDEIGDFILFHNFISVIRQSKKFDNYQITLCGNIIWKELAENSHRDEIDQFVWLDKREFYNNIRYKYHILKNIYQKGFEVVINPRYSREILFDDAIVKSSNASMRMGSEGSLENHARWKRQLFTDRYYTQVIPQNTQNFFEFYRNKIFFEKVLGEQISLKKPTLHLKLSKQNLNLPEKYITLFPGAGEKKRMWDISKFSELVKFILYTYSLSVVVCGSSQEKELSQTLHSDIKNDLLLDMTEKTTLSEFVTVIENSILLISNETSAIHMAAAVKTPFICISNGKHFGRFNPYPKDIFAQAEYVYPPKIMDHLNQMDVLQEKYRFDSDLDINLIEVDAVKKCVKKFLSEKDLDTTQD